jgi:hypothetical protein
MNIISAQIAILSISSLAILLISNYYINYIFSETIVSQDIINSNLKKNIENKTLMNTGCDFLNLCDEQSNSKLNGISFPKDNNIIDISFFKSHIELPFP